VSTALYDTGFHGEIAVGLRAVTLPDGGRVSKEVWTAGQQLMCKYQSLCLQCFDAVGWAAGRASGL